MCKRLKNGWGSPSEGRKDKSKMGAKSTKHKIKNKKLSHIVKEKNVMEMYMNKTIKYSVA